ncbi:hypothetical protein SDC9_30398 [bioreactor metagenome]|uniref:Uncharacterized protein n=1 Tax=bioreactor metagenome TaxID=1076179 RepID=A0A644V0K3_9ZZZZ
MLGARLVELDHQSVALDLHHLAIAELLVEDARADAEGDVIDGGDGGRARRGSAMALQPLPARRIVDIGAARPLLHPRAGTKAAARAAEGPGGAETAAIKPGRRQHLDIGGGQFVDEARRQLRLPLAIDPAVAGEGDRAQPLGASDADIGQPAFLLEPLLPGLVHRALAREQPVLPARQEDDRKFQPLRRMQRHDRDLVLALGTVIVHDQRDVLEEALQVLELLERLHQFLQVLEPARRLGGLVVLPHRDIARLLEDALDQTDVGMIVRRRHRGLVELDQRVVILGRARRRGGRGGADLGVPARDILDEKPQLPARLAADLARRDQPARSVKEAQPRLARQHLDARLRLLAQPALRRVDDTLEGKIVLGRDGQAEIGHCVADLEPFIEPRPADHPIGQADGQEAVLEGAHLVAGAHQNRLIGQPHRSDRAPPRGDRLDLLADPARLFLAIPMADQPHLLAALRLGPERLAKPPLVRGDQPRGGGQDMLGRAVILFEPDHHRAREILLEAQDVADLGAAPAIDRLVIIADAADVAMALRQQPQPQILRDVGVLILVDKDIAEPALILRQHIRVGLEDRHHMQQQIAEIDGIQRAQPVLIGGVKLGAAVVEGRGLGALHPLGRQRAVLPAVDDARELARRPALLVHVRGEDQLFQQPDLVVGVEDGEVRLQPDEFRMPPQQLDADRVEGAQPRHPLDRTAEQPAHALLHLARGLVGEGHGEDLVRAATARMDQMRDARGQGLGLAGAGARQHQHRAVKRLDRGALRGVQPLEIGRGAALHSLQCALRETQRPLERIIVVIPAHGGNLAARAGKAKSCSASVRAHIHAGSIPAPPAPLPPRLG